jgi:hypothetical protein
MRWLFPLTAGLALVLTAACEEHPLEPAASANLAQSAPAPNSGARLFTYDVNWTMNVCDVDIVDFSGTVRTVEHDSQWLPDDHLYRIMYINHYNLTGIGRTTGYAWRAIGSEHGYVHIYLAGKGDPEGPDKELGNFSIKFIGQAQAPDFAGRFLGHETTNANGDRVVSFSLSTPQCG